MLRAVRRKCRSIKSRALSDLPVIKAANRVISKIQCPYCGRRGHFVKWGFYERHITEPDPRAEGPARRDRVMRVQRLRCACLHTHALIDTGVVPYRLYSLEFMLRTVCTWSRHQSVEALCSMLQISPATLYHWGELLRNDLMAAGIPSTEYEDWIENWTRITDLSFQQNFMLRCGRRFLERRRPVRPHRETPANGWPMNPAYLKWPRIH